MQFDPSAGYRRLDSWILASIIQFATFRFCEKFLTRKLDPTGRQYDQMTQAARSGKVNIVEGSSRSATSKETEMKLTDVAYASLTELCSDYEDWLLKQDIVPWHKNSAEAKEVFDVWLTPPKYGSDWVHDSCVHLLEEQKKFARWLKSDDSIIVANCLLILIRRTMKMLLGQLQAQGDNFEKTGGFREQLTQVRIEARAKQQNAPRCPDCDSPMTRRKATTGKNAGNEFWGCTRYPECRGTRQVEEGNDNQQKSIEVEENKTETETETEQNKTR
jgi:four helix bundle suffix protein